MFIQSINFSNQQFKGQMIRSKTLDNIIEHSSLKNLNEFYNYLKVMNKINDGLIFNVEEKFVKSQAPDFIKRVLAFKLTKPNFSRIFKTSDEWPKDMPPSNYDYQAALFYINQELENHYSLMKTPDNFSKKDEIINNINNLLDNK